MHTNMSINTCDKCLFECVLQSSNRHAIDEVFIEEAPAADMLSSKLLTPPGAMQAMHVQYQHKTENDTSHWST
jgi:hypothetical protein